MKPIHLPIVLVALFAALTAACDLGTKQWAVAALAESPAAQRSAVCEHNPRTGGFTHHRRPAADVVVVRDALELHYAENCVAAFGILTSAPAPARRAVLYVGAGLCAAFLLYLARQRDLTRTQGVALGFIAGGGLGNLVDRISRGYVVDFIHAHYRAFDWPVFNVADIAIAIGVGLLVLTTLRAPAIPAHVE